MKFDWDKGNWPKCGKHGLPKDEIEAVFEASPHVLVDPENSHDEERYKAIGRNPKGRHVYVSFTIRTKKDVIHIRPISARYMHRKEIERYEQRPPKT